MKMCVGYMNCQFRKRMLEKQINIKSILIFIIWLNIHICVFIYFVLSFSTIALEKLKDLKKKHVLLKI